MFYITVSNGLLNDGHRKKMGSAVWDFLWLIDKVTKIDAKGIGWIWGGKPIKLSEMCDGVTEDTVSINLDKLETLGYITKIRTPYGLKIGINKIKKSFNISKRDSSKTSNLSEETSNLNKTIHKDSTLIQKDLPDWLDKKSWKEWLEYRSQKRCSMTEMTINKQLDFLSKYKEDHVKILEASITAGWIGLFPLKKQYPQKLDVGTPFVKGKYSDKSKEIIDD